MKADIADGAVDWRMRDASKARKLMMAKEKRDSEALFEKKKKDDAREMKADLKRKKREEEELESNNNRAVHYRQQGSTNKWVQIRDVLPSDLQLMARCDAHILNRRNNAFNPSSLSSSSSSSSSSSIAHPSATIEEDQDVAHLPAVDEDDDVIYMYVKKVGPK